MSKFQTTPVVFTPGSAFDTGYRPELFYERDEQLNQYIHHLEPALQGRPPTNLLIDGEKGTGKSSTTKHALSLLAEEMEAQGRGFSTVFVTACDESSSQQTLTQIVNTIREAHSEETIAHTGYPYESVVEKLLEELERFTGVLYVVIDEADDIDNPDVVLRELSRINERDRFPELRVGTIAILNDPTMTEDLRSTTESSLQTHRLTFPPYSAEELTTILQQRSEAGFVEGVVSEEKIRYCTAKCLQMGGDIRDAIKLLQESGEVARCRFREAADREDCGLIKADIDAAEESLTPIRVEQTVRNLSGTGQQVLFTVACATAYGKAPARTRALTRLHINLHKGSTTSERTMRTYLNSLHERGLVARGDINNSPRSPNSGQYYEYGLSIELQTVFELLHEAKLHDDTTVSMRDVCKRAVHNNELSPPQRKNILSLY
ncbi:Cdc6/Cdc18 family protein [Halomarina oriensis]|uniref:ORC1-type DNA replication protein n=1 Tax=Halomarina oriensis TaxID=671145 RepID=A0A6B0GY28_9EURY|nr:AAA family ATPase [Halomarina oriensis]MWG36688.1 AAA family ATPase [Halomarina oriensis]